MKKRYIIIFIIIIIVINTSIIFLMNYKSKDIKPKTVPKLYINTSNEINDNYSNIKLDIIDNNKKINYNNVKIKLRGHITRYEEKHPFTIKFDKKTKLFNLTESKKYVLLANTFDVTLMRNKLVYDFASKTSIKYTVKSTYVDLYINNNYIGNYLLCDKISVDKDKINIDKNKDYLIELETPLDRNNDIYIYSKINNWRFRIKSPKNINDKQKKKLQLLLNNTEKIIESNNYKDISKHIDIQSFVDSYIIQEYFKNVDCNISSLYFYFKDNKLYAGPAWDFDQSMGLSEDKEYNNGFGKSYEGLYCNKNIYEKLLKNKEFKKEVIKRYNNLQKHIKNTYKKDIPNNYIMYKDTYLKNGCLWKKDIACREQDYQARINYIKKWLKNRNKWLLNYYKL